MAGPSRADAEHVPIGEAWRIADWLHGQRCAGTPAVMDTNVSSDIRICLAAAERGLDISGTFFRFGGEPFTAARAEIVRRAGCGGCCHFSMAEAGTLGIACGRPAVPDDVHVLSDKIAIVPSRRRVEGADEIPALLVTTVLPLCPRLMLNVEIGDYGVLEERPCGCAVGDLGYRLHLSRISAPRSCRARG